MYKQFELTNANITATVKINKWKKKPSIIYTK